MLKILIIADDLTGAAECAAACALYGLDAFVILDHSARIPPGEVIAFDANTRRMPPEEAAAETARILRRYPAGIVYKKIDSTLRGNVRAEVAAALEAYRASGHSQAIAVAAPAFPAMGRITRDGRQFARGAALENGNLRELLSDAVICDAESDDDLRSIARQWIGHNVLWVGSAGLIRFLPEAAGLEREPPPAAPRIAGPIIFAAGSPTERSREQVAALREEARGSCDIVITGEAEVVASKVAKYAESMGALIVTGGETARAVLRGLGVAALRSLGELETGVPISMAESPRRFPVITKAGDFGNRETLLRCRAALLKSV